MPLPQNKQAFKIISWSIKIAIVAFAFWFIYLQVIAKQDILEGLGDLLESPSQNPLIFLVLILVFVNWGFEAFKWKSLIDKVETISIAKAYKAIFSGVTVSIFTPNRIGEYAGRIFHLEKADRINAVLITMICSVSQLLVTVFAGLISITIFFPAFFPIDNYLPEIYYYALAVLTFALAIFLLAAYLNTSLLSPVIKKMTILGKWRAYGRLFSRFSKAELKKVLIFSFGRYAVFTFQFFLLLHIFELNISYPTALMLISITYFVMAIIPTIAIAELGIRGSVAVYFIGMTGGNELAILTASFLLWLINLALPALIGTLFVFNLKFFRANK